MKPEHLAALLLPGMKVTRFDKRAWEFVETRLRKLEPEYANEVRRILREHQDKQQ